MRQPPSPITDLYSPTGHGKHLYPGTGGEILAVNPAEQIQSLYESVDSSIDVIAFS
jgi:hypothetical protein